MVLVSTTGPVGSEEASEEVSGSETVELTSLDVGLLTVDSVLSAGMVQPQSIKDNVRIIDKITSNFFIGISPFLVCIDIIPLQYIIVNKLAKYVFENTLISGLFFSSWAIILLYFKTEGKRMYNKVTLCGVDTSKLPVMKEAEKERLLKLVRAGDMKAREQLINGNLKLVLSVIQRFTGRGESLDDIFQIGCIGLIKSIDNFDITQNVRFSTYAVPMIIGEIRRYLRDNSPVRVSRSIKDVAYRAMKAKERLTASLEREPTVDELAKELDIPRSEVVMALESIVDPVSLQEPVYSDGGDTIYVLDQIGDNNDDKNWLDEISFRQAIKDLSEREKRILQLRFIDGRTQMEVSKEIGISQAQVSRLEKNAIERIKG